MSESQQCAQSVLNGNEHLSFYRREDRLGEAHHCIHIYNCNKRKKSLWPLINNSTKQNGVVQRAWIQTAWVETQKGKDPKLQVATKLN